MELEEENGVSLVHVLRIAFRRWNLLLIIMAVVFIAGFIGIQAFYNRGKVTYTTTFEYDIVGLSDGKYIDGEKFDYRELISLNALNEVKNSDDKFKSVKVEQMVENGDISISQIVATDDNKNPENLGYFKIQFLARYFDNAKQAKDFAAALIVKPVTLTKEKLDTLDYYDNINLYNQALILETKIGYLKKQLELLDSKYDKLIADYGDTMYNQALISTYKNEQDLYFINNSLDSLNVEIEEAGLAINNADYLNTLNASVYNLNKEKEANTEKINKLQTKVNELLAQVQGSGTLQSAEISAYNTQIADLTSRNVDIDVELEITNRKINNLELDTTSAEYTQYKTDLDAFIAKIDSYKDKLKNYTDKFVEIQKSVVVSNCITHYAKSSVIETTGGLSTLISIVLCLVIGLVLGCIVNLIIDRKLLNEKYYAEFIANTKKAEEVEVKENE